MKYEEFEQQVKSAGLIPKQCSKDHWQIRGGKFCVNFYPHKLGGPSYYINGMNTGSRRRRVTLSEAILAANDPPFRKLHVRTRSRKRLKNIKRSLYNDNQICFWCKKDLQFHEATLDHVIPLSKGGSNGVDNFVLACEECNAGRKNDMPERTGWEKT